MAVAAYSRLSGYVYVWTLQPEWQSRMSAILPLRASQSIFPVVPASGRGNSSRPVRLSPFRVVAAPAADWEGSGAGAGCSAKRFSLVWAPQGGTIELRLSGTLVGSIPVQCP
jgi:hypothetical protein